MYVHAARCSLGLDMIETVIDGFSLVVGVYFVFHIQTV